MQKMCVFKVCSSSHCTRVTSTRTATTAFDAHSALRHVSSRPQRTHSSKTGITKRALDTWLSVFPSHCLLTPRRRIHAPCLGNILPPSPPHRGCAPPPPPPPPPHTPTCCIPSRFQSQGRTRIPLSGSSPYPTLLTGTCRSRPGRSQHRCSCDRGAWACVGGRMGGCLGGYMGMHGRCMGVHGRA